MKRRVVIEMKDIIVYIFIMPFLFAALMQVLKLPSVIKYTIDVCWIFLAIVSVRKGDIHKNKSSILFLWVSFYIIYTIFLYIIDYQSLIYYIWGFRNNFRFFIFFFGCIAFLRTKTINNLIRLFDALFWVNFAVVIVQFFFLGFRQDFLGGIFGTETGCNGSLNVFLILSIIKSIAYMAQKKEKLRTCVFKFTSIIVIAALSELKFVYIELLVIVFFAIIFTGITAKKIIILGIVFVGVLLGLRLLQSVFPMYGEGEYTIKNLIENGMSTSGYTVSNDFNRLTGFSISNELFLTSLDERIFGLGLGNCDSNLSYEVLITPFASQFTDLHYAWFMVYFVYLETGIIGLVFLFGFFILVFALSYKQYKKNPNEYNYISMVVSIWSILLCFYNNSMRTEAAYMIYFFLSVPFVTNHIEQGIMNEVYNE